MIWETYKCCMNCYAKIEDESLLTSRLWPVLCGHAAKEGGYVLIKEENALLDDLHLWEELIKEEKILLEHLHVLEELRFITTHETDDIIVIRLEGFNVTVNNELICCIDLDNHAKKIKM